jgi:hypothetical protein
MAHSNEPSDPYSQIKPWSCSVDGGGQEEFHEYYGTLKITVITYVSKTQCAK